MRDGNKVTGRIQVQGQLYSLDPLEKGGHAFIKIDASKFPPEAEPIAAEGDAATDSNVVTPPKPKAAHSTIRVMVAMTQDAYAAQPNLPSIVYSAFTLSNQTNANSGVDITFLLVRFILSTYVEPAPGNYQTILNDAVNPNHGFGAELARERAKDRADLVVVMMKESSVCGVAKVNSTPATAFSAVHYGCVNNQTFAHEIGHNIGLLHNWEPGTAVTIPLI